MPYNLLIEMRQTIKVYRNMETRWHNQYCRGKAISITYSELVSVDLFIRHAKRIR